MLCSWWPLKPQLECRAYGNAHQLCIVKKQQKTNAHAVIVSATGVFVSVKLKNVREETCPYITLDVENQSVRSDCHLTCQHLFPSVTCKLKLERSRCRRQLIECIPSLSKHTQFLPHGAVSDQYSSSCSAYSPVIPSTDI